jgi:hypothetical protein
MSKLGNLTKFVSSMLVGAGLTVIGAATGCFGEDIETKLKDKFDMTQSSTDVCVSDSSAVIKTTSDTDNPEKITTALDDIVDITVGTDTSPIKKINTEDSIFISNIRGKIAAYSLISGNAYELLEFIPEHFVSKKFIEKHVLGFIASYIDDLTSRHYEVGEWKDFLCRIYDENAKPKCTEMQDGLMDLVTRLPRQIIVVNKSKFQAHYFDFNTSPRLIVDVDGDVKAYQFEEREGDIIGEKYTWILKDNKSIIYFSDNGEAIGYSNNNGENKQMYFELGPKARGILDALANGKYEVAKWPVMTYTVGTGRDNGGVLVEKDDWITPEGIFWVDKMELNPFTYYRKMYSLAFADDPKMFEKKKNRGKFYGARIISWNGPGEFDDLIAFHGTSKKAQWSVGHARSQGCLRMYNDNHRGNNVVNLYDRLMKTRGQGLGTLIVVTP